MLAEVKKWEQGNFDVSKELIDKNGEFVFNAAVKIDEKSMIEGCGGWPQAATRDQ